MKNMKNIDKIVEIVRLFWPKFYNRITWVVVIAGLALISAPLWEQLVSALISKTFDLSSYIPNEPIYGVALVIIGLAYHLGAIILSSKPTPEMTLKQKESREHDISLARDFFEIAPEENFYFFLDVLGSNHSSDDALWKTLSGIERFGNLSGNEFLNPEVKEHFEALHSDVARLTSFISRNFFVMGTNTDRTYLYPDLNGDRGGNYRPEEIARYDKFATQMIEIIMATKENYKALRRVIKTELTI
jgi:hypothetical protein